MGSGIRASARPTLRVIAVVLAASVFAAASAGLASARTTRHLRAMATTHVDAVATPHLDAVARALNHRAPGTERKVWWMTRGNTLPAGWLLQTPNCWGRLSCGVPPPGGAEFLKRIAELISQARFSVDFAGLFPPPSGGFEQAIVNGLIEAKHRGHRPTVRILLGTPPGHPHKLPSAYIDGFCDASVAACQSRPPTCRRTVGWWPPRGITRSFSMSMAAPRSSAGPTGGAPTI